ncbi:hypothetical protein TNCV_510971 [Trichonephila clavipes]|nr:hypothetical protein TNCV_510971 [Trichonephila clavipes]
MNITYDEITAEIKNAQSNDEYITTIKQFVDSDKVNDFQIRNDILFKLVDGKELLVIPDSMQTEIIKRAHDKGHFAVAKTEQIITLDYYFPKLTSKVQNVLANCVHCILVNRKRGKQEGFLNPISKVIDAFTKFTWIYPVKTTSTSDALRSLELQKSTFGNPSRIITDQGSSFTSHDFKNYCQNESIEHIKITTGIPRGNGQVERIHNALIPVLTKLSINEPEKWFKHAPNLLRVLNSTVSSTTKYSPFELLTGSKMKTKDDEIIIQLLNDENTERLMQEREEMRHDAKVNIQHVQDTSKAQFDKKRKQPHIFKKDELVAIKRTQFGTGLKLRPKFYGPYRIKTVKPHDRYEVEKVGQHEGPHLTSTAVDFMKRWSTADA